MGFLRNRRLLIIVIMAVLVVLGGGTATYWFFLRSKPASQPKQPTGQGATQPVKRTITAKTKHYKSQSFRLEFDYPEDWKVDDSATDQLYVKSPVVDLTDAGGQTVGGIITFAIKSKQLPMTEFDKGNAVAARDSVKIAYTSPTASQRGSTYLSFLQYASSPGGNALDGLYITGDNGYQKDQAIPKVDFTPVDPIISITFTSEDANKSSISAASWDDISFSGPLQSMLQSLVIN